VARPDARAAAASVIVFAWCVIATVYPVITNNGQRLQSPREGPGVVESSTTAAGPPGATARQRTPGQRDARTTSTRSRVVPARGEIARPVRPVES